MKLLDIIILVPVVWGAYKGFKKGLFMELSMLIAFVLATILGFKLINIVMLYLQPYFGPENRALPTISFIITFIGVLVGMNFVTKLIKKFLNVSILGSLDDWGGALLGIIKATFILSTFMWLLDTAKIILPENLTHDTIVYPYFVQISPTLLDWGAKLLPFATDLVKSINELIVAPKA